MDQHGKLAPGALRRRLSQGPGGRAELARLAGLAPIESIDTGIADQNRRRFIADWPTAS